LLDHSSLCAGYQQRTTVNADVIEEFALAADGLAATAAHSSLKRIQDLCSGDPSRQRLYEALLLSALSARIGLRLAAGEEAFSRQEPGRASAQWSRALLLMNRLARFATVGTLPLLAPHQKSGSAG
jgi:hypothetical protein